MDFDLDVYRSRILDVLDAYGDQLLWHGSLKAATITELGVGESNLMLQVTLDGQPALAMRLAYREDIAAHLLPQEFRLLQQVPEDVGPRPFVLDMSRQVLPYPFAILSYVPGTPLVTYSEELFRLHATKLALLHRQEFAGWTDRWGQLRDTAFDLYQDFQDGVARWRRLSPRVFEEELVLQLLPRLDAYFREHNHLFTALTRFPLIHGDLCASNILVHEGEMRYIDWEYARYGDVALDLFPPSI